VLLTVMLFIVFHTTTVNSIEQLNNVRRRWRSYTFYSEMKSVAVMCRNIARVAGNYFYSFVKKYNVQQKIKYKNLVKLS
jgi:hypothetical protein